MTEDLKALMQKANNIFLENFPPTTCFERAIFFSWHCDIRDCTYCFMSTQPADETKRKAVRSMESLLAELIICKNLGWQIGFISGGIGAFKKDKFKELLKNMHEITKEKFWLNLGALDNETLEQYAPYTKGVVGSIETINAALHKKVCPSKPIQPYLDMFKQADKLNLKKAITIILGLGETKEDFNKLKELIETYSIEKIHLYGLNPQKGTPYENTESPSKEYQAWWIAQTRIAFPRIDIQCGVWEDKVDRISFLLNAGANSISKYPALKKFNTKSAREIEHQAKLANRQFKGTLTKLENIDWKAQIQPLNLDPELKLKIMQKLEKYLIRLRKNK